MLTLGGLKKLFMVYLERELNKYSKYKWELIGGI